MEDIVAEIRKNLGRHGGEHDPPSEDEIRAILRAALEATGLDQDCVQAAPAALRHLDFLSPEEQVFYRLVAAAYPEGEEKE